MRVQLPWMSEHLLHRCFLCCDGSCYWHFHVITRVLQVEEDTETVMTSPMTRDEKEVSVSLIPKLNSCDEMWWYRCRPSLNDGSAGCADTTLNTPDITTDSRERSLTPWSSLWLTVVWLRSFRPNLRLPWWCGRWHTHGKLCDLCNVSAVVNWCRPLSPIYRRWNHIRSHLSCQEGRRNYWWPNDVYDWLRCLCCMIDDYYDGRWLEKRNLLWYEDVFECQSVARSRRL